MSRATLRVSGLSCQIAGERRLEDIGFTLDPGERLGLFGPSGAGKSLLLRALLGLSPRGARVEGTMHWGERRFSLASPRELASLRGSTITLVAQAAGLSLDPVVPVRRQVEQLVRLHRTGRPVDELLERAGFPLAAAKQVPGQLSGGMAQRAALAAALACAPRVLLADEPTASLDTVTQAAVLTSLFDACTTDQTSTILVSHDLALLGRHCDRIAVLREGRLIADGSVEELLDSPEPAVSELVDPHRPERQPEARA